MTIADELEELALPLTDSGQAGFVVALANKAVGASKYIRELEAQVAAGSRPAPLAVVGQHEEPRGDLTTL